MTGMNEVLLSPPAAFLILLAAVTAFSAALSKFAFLEKDRPKDAGKSYAYGEDVPTHLMQPDYSQFFPFAFFFTVLHVVALTIATVPVETPESFAMAVLYVLGAVAGLVILFRR